MARARPDGRTVLASIDTPFTVNPHLYRDMGFDPSREPGTGLRGMRDRVASGGGELAVTSGADGTRVRVHFPAVPA